MLQSMTRLKTGHLNLDRLRIGKRGELKTHGQKEGSPDALAWGS